MEVITSSREGKVVWGKGGETGKGLMDCHLCARHRTYVIKFSPYNKTYEVLDLHEWVSDCPVSHTVMKWESQYLNQV